MKKFLGIILFLGVLAGVSFGSIVNPVNTVVSSDKYLYVPDTAISPGISPNIKVYDTSTTTPSLKFTISPTSLGGTPTGMCLSPDGSKLYVAMISSAAVKVFNAKTGAVINSSVSGTTFVSPKQVAVSLDGKRLYVVDASADAVKVINVSGTPTYVTSISPAGSSNLYGVAVSADDKYVAITRKNAGGSAYVYEIVKDSSGNITSYTLKKSITEPASGLIFPSYVLFSPDSEKLFIRVDQTTSPYADVLIYKASDSFAASTTVGSSNSIRLISASEQDAGNLHGEAMTVSPDGKFLYLTHYRTTADSGETSSNINKVHAYRIALFSDADGTLRTNWNWNTTYGDNKFRNDLLASKDGLGFTPDGSKVWFTGSEGGTYISSKWTGYTDAGGNLVDPIPAAPTITHPSASDVLSAYDGNASWTPNSGDSNDYKRYKIDYKKSGTNTWVTLNGYTSDLTQSLATLEPGSSYVVRVRMFWKKVSEGVNGVWGPYSYSPQFTKTQPKITSLQVKDNDVSLAYITQSWGYVNSTVKIMGAGFGNEKKVVKIGGVTIPAANIYSWEDNTIEAGVVNYVNPNYAEAGATKITVEAYGYSGNATFTIRPKIANLSIDSGYVGETLDIYGFSFGAIGTTATVYFGSTQVATTTVDRSTSIGKISVVVPATLASGLYNIKVRINGQDSNGKSYTVLPTPSPVISSVEVKASGGTTYTAKTWGYVYDSVKLTGTNFGASAGSIKLGSVVIPAANIYSWTTTSIEFGIPIKDIATYVAPGLATIEVTNIGSKKGTTSFTVKPSITSLSPTSGFVGDSLDIYGFAFGPKDSSVTVYFDLLNTVSVDATVTEVSDSISKITIVVPQLAVGAHPVLVAAAGEVSNFNKKFTVQTPPTPSVSRIEVKDGTAGPYVTQDWGYTYNTVKVTGSGFGATEGSIALAGNQEIEVPASSSTSTTKVFSWSDTEIIFGIPRTSATRASSYIDAGLNGIKITNIYTNKITKDFYVRPKISSALTPASGNVGQSVDIYGFAFGAQSSAVKVYFGTTVVDTTVAERNTSIDKITVLVPALSAGTYNVKVESNGQQSNDNYTFTIGSAVTPVISGIEVKDNDASSGFPYTAQDWAYIYSTVKIMGTGFGADPGDGNRGSATNNVTLNGLTIRDAVGGDGLQVYSWSDTTIEVGIARRIGTTYITSGANPIIVTASGLASNSTNLNIKPRVYGVNPNEGVSGTQVSISGTALSGTRSVKIGGLTASEVSFVQNPGSDPDGTDPNGNDVVVVSVPMLSTGDHPVVAEVAGLLSNGNINFKVLAASAPSITQIIPNVAPNTADITVAVKGTNFQNGATVVLKKTGEGDIAGTVVFVSPTELSVALPVTGKTIGKYDVVVTNPDTQSYTKAKGFTISDGSGEIALILDDFEGVAVSYPDGYSKFPSPADLDIQISTTAPYEGEKNASITYPLSANGYRGYNAHLQNKQDITNFNSITLVVKGSGTLTGKIQVKDVDGKIFSASNGSGVPLTSSWAKQTIKLSDFVEVDASGNPVLGGAQLNKSGITDYQIIFTGNAASVAPIEIDYIAATGYSTGEVDANAPRNLMASKNGEDVVLTWDAPTAGEPGTAYRIYSGTTYVNITTPMADVSVGTHTWTHPLAVSGSDSHMYVVKAVTGISESNSSNVAFIEKSVKTPGSSNIFWVSVPYLTTWTTAQSIADDVNYGKTAGQDGTCLEIGKWDTNLGTYQTISYLEGLGWMGDNFNIKTGDSYYVAVVGTTKWQPAGAHNPDYQFDLAYPNGTNIYWVSLPYNGDYTDAQSIADHVNNVNPGAALEIGRFTSDGLYETLSYLEGLGWMGTNFTFAPGEGYYLSIGSPVSGLTPKVK